jgi:hypothetical protein
MMTGELCGSDVGDLNRIISTAALGDQSRVHKYAALEALKMDQTVSTSIHTRC